MAGELPGASLIIDIISDVMCPWCYVGKKRLDRALAALPEISADLRWRPFQLDPTLPPGGKDRGQYLREKFGSDQRSRDIYRAIQEAGIAEGIAFDFEAIRVAPNTLDAHRVIRWAANAGESAQHRVAQRLFALYFEEGADIGNHSVLAGAAADAGMDAAIVESLLKTDKDRDAVRSEIETAMKMGVTGVPCFIIERRFAIMGAQDASVMADAFRQIAAAKIDAGPPPS